MSLPKCPHNIHLWRDVTHTTLQRRYPRHLFDNSNCSQQLLSSLLLHL